MKYAHTPMESLPSVAPRSEVVSKADVKKTSSASVAPGRKDLTGDAGDESEEERERRLHELQEQVSTVH